MSCLHGEGIVICGNFVKPTKKRPKNWIERGYRGVLVPFKFQWREKIGKVKCDCRVVKESYQPWYGYTWYHSDECALIKQIAAKPSLMNLWCYQKLPMIAQSD